MLCQFTSLAINFLHLSNNNIIYGISQIDIFVLLFNKLIPYN